MSGAGHPKTAGPEIHTLATLVHGRYLLDGAMEDREPPLLVGFHGYGENAEHHHEKLCKIPGSSGWVRCAVAAPHPFYTRKQEIVRSWMTAEDRELAIDDNIRYVAAVVAGLRRRFGNGPLVFTGFSQGVAMAWRAVARSGHPCHGLIALAGDVPPEVAASELPAPPPVLLGRGKNDPWYDQAKMERDLEAMARLGVEVTSYVFDGGHDWSDDFYRAAGEFLEGVRIASSRGVEGG